VQITPAFVREAYTLLRQSIIHVEHDAIDFDEEELEGERREERRVDDSEDVPMAANSTDPADENSIPVRVNVAGRPAAVAQGQSSSQPDDAVPGSEPTPAPAAPKRRMVITHDKYIELQTLVVMQVSEQERKIGKGVDREELIDWYLEQREDAMQDVEQFEYEKELIVKLLRKLVKVRNFLDVPQSVTHRCSLQDNFLIEVKGDVQDSLRPSADEESQESAGPTGDDVRVYYLVHPSVDTESSMTSGY